MCVQVWLSVWRVKTLSNRLAVLQSPFGLCVVASRYGLAKGVSLAPPCMPRVHAIAANPAKVP